MKEACQTESPEFFFIKQGSLTPNQLSHFEKETNEFEGKKGTLFYVLLTSQVILGVI